MSARRLSFHLIPHTHWDREWYLPRAGFQARLASAIGALARLLQHDAAARFTLDGQTVLLDDALAVRPELAPALTQAARDGRLAIGPWHVLADEQIPSGESLLRNLLIGTATAARFGRRMDVLYSPDAFGHPAALPMLAREFGLAAGVAWRGLGGSDPGGDLFRWRAPSGDEILLYHLPPQGYEIGADLLDAAPHLAARWRAIRDTLTARAASPHVAIFVGADHHAPPSELSALRDALQEIETDHDVVISTLAEYCAAIGNRLSLPELQGELRWSYGYTWTLQGVHATRSQMKRRHCLAELSLSRRAEPLAALAHLFASDDRIGLLRVAWRSLVECQFHDTLGGCASDAVADEQAVRLTSVEVVADEIRRASLAALTGHDPDRARRLPHRAVPTLVLWNPVPRVRGGITTALITFFRRDIRVGPPSGSAGRTGPGYQPFVLTTAEGERIPVQLLDVQPGLERIDAPHHYPDQDEVDRAWVAFESPTLSGLGLASLQPASGLEMVAAGDLEVQEDLLRNRFVTVRVGGDGTLQLIDHRTGEGYHDLLRLEDQVDEGDSYTVFVPSGSLTTTQTTPLARRVIASGPLLGAIDVHWRLDTARGPIGCRLVVELRADSPLVRLRLDIDNRSPDHRLRARLAIGAGRESLAGAAFGFEHRPAEAFNPDDYPAETPVLTAPAHRYVAAGEGSRALALLAPGFFEYEWTPRRDLLFTLLRATGELSKPDLPTRPGHAGWPTATPGAQEPGMHRIHFALLAGDHELVDFPARLEAAWEDAFLPIEGSFVRDFTIRGDDDRVPPGITLEGEGLVCSAIKPPESGEGIVLRCFNTTDRAVEGCWRVDGPVAEAVALRADETAIGPLAVTPDGGIAFVVPARRIFTVLVSLAGTETVAAKTDGGYR